MEAALATPIDKYRITFALPWEDMLLLGTTDEEYEGDPADVAVNEKDIARSWTRPRSPSGTSSSSVT